MLRWWTFSKINVYEDVGLGCASPEGSCVRVFSRQFNSSILDLQFPIPCGCNPRSVAPYVFVDPLVG